MKKDIFITAYRPGMTLPSAYETYEEALQYFDKERQALFRVQVDVPEPDATLQAEEVKP